MEKPSTPAARAAAAIAIIENFILVVVLKVVSLIEDYEQILCDEGGNESDVMSTWEEHALGFVAGGRVLLDTSVMFGLSTYLMLEKRKSICLRRLSFCKLYKAKK